MRISDWSSDVCSSDLVAGVSHKGRVEISSIGLHLLGDGYYGIYQNSRDGDTAWTQNSGCNHFPHLCNNFSSAVVSSKRSEEHTSELQSLMRISYAVFCLKKKTQLRYTYQQHHKPIT